MTQVTGAFDSYDAVGNREELSNRIWMLSPEDTPFMSLIGREPVKTTHPEWQTDTLATPAANAKVEGDTWTFSDTDATSRVGNYTQISDKNLNVTKTQERVDKAGRKSEKAYKLKKRSTELKKDMEFNLLQNNASVAGNATTARELGGFPAWLETNAFREGGGTDGGFNSGTGLVDAAGNGSLRAFTQGQLNDVIESTYKNSTGNVTTIMLSPYNKRVFSGFPGISDLRSEVKGKKQATIYAGADMYVSDFGDMMVVPNRIMATNAATARYVYTISPEYAKVGILRDIQKHDVAQIGDADRAVINCEYTLVVKNEAAHGCVADVYGLTAST